MRDHLHDQIFDIDDTSRSGGDSMPVAEKETWHSFFTRLDSAINGDLKFVITLEDPLANGYVRDLCARLLTRRSRRKSILARMRRKMNSV